MNPINTVFAVAMLMAAIMLSYAFAVAGEPQSAWLWCHVMGLC